jgi:hypothetical protein
MQNQLPQKKWLERAISALFQLHCIIQHLPVKVTPVSALLIIFSFLPAFSQTELSLQIRPRVISAIPFSYNDSENSTEKISPDSRVRISLSGTKKGFSFNAGLQQLTYANSSGLQISNQLKPSDAWVKFQKKGFGLKAGRQQLSYDDQRLLGKADWETDGRFHNAAILHYSSDSVKIQLGYSKSFDAIRSEFGNKDSYLDMQLGWFHRKYKTIDVSLIVINQRYRSINPGENLIYSRQTFGPHFTVITKPADIIVSSYYQKGYDQTGKLVDAFMFSAKIQEKNGSLVNLALGYDILSGTKNDGYQPVNRTFVTVSGSNHLFYGNMDYMYRDGLYPTAGLKDLYFLSTFQINKKLKGEFNIHRFSSQAGIFLQNEEYARIPGYLGTEIDLSVTAKILKTMKLDLGYSILYSSGTLNMLRNRASDQPLTWFYAMVSIDQVFRKGKNRIFYSAQTSKI